MAGVIPAPSGKPPLPMDTAHISSNEKAVLFMNFAVGHTELHSEHDAFIKNILVPWYINQIESLNFKDKSMNVRPIGKASATGSRQRNMELSLGRAGAVGNAVKKYFDQQKSRGAISKNVQVNVLPIGRGDEEERGILGNSVNTLPQKMVEDRSNQFRSVILSMQVVHNVVEDDEVVLCRQILNCKLKVERVPANELERRIDEFSKNIPTLNPVLGAVLSEFLSTIKFVFKEHIKEFLKNADFYAFELLVIFKEVEFLIPTDLVLMFEFKDSRGRMKRYIFSGSANKVDLSVFDVISQVLSFLKWINKLQKTIDGFEKLLDKLRMEKKENWEFRIKSIKILLEALKRLISLGDKLAKLVTEPNSYARQILGDDIIDALRDALGGGSISVATEFVPVQFESHGVFDIFRFEGVARTVTVERIGSPTTVTLDFSARQNQTLLGFQGHAIVQRKFAWSLTLVSYQQSTGKLIPA